MASYDLSTVKDYIEDARTLLLDRIQPYRYSDISLLVALNLALNFAFMVPLQYMAVSGDEVPIEEQFRLGFVYGLCAHALIRDQEDVQDARSTIFMQTFHSILIGISPPPMGGGTPGSGSPQT